MIAIGSDHGGLNLKNEIKLFLIKKNIQVKDYGSCSDESVDYPDYGHDVARAVASGECEKGIIICGTGIGISVSANKVPGIRAALCTDAYMARMSREHNNANVLALGGRVIGAGLALDIVDTWLSSEFINEGRHRKRVSKIDDIEKKYL